MVGSVLLMCLPLAAYPHCPNLLSLYISAFLSGSGHGSINTVSHVIIFNIWKGRDSGPYMHAVHFCFGLGAFLAPLIARPFLINQVNSSLTELNTVWTIKALYPLVSSYGLLVTL